MPGLTFQSGLIDFFDPVDYFPNTFDGIHPTIYKMLRTLQMRTEGWDLSNNIVRVWYPARLLNRRSHRDHSRLEQEIPNTDLYMYQTRISSIP